MSDEFGLGESTFSRPCEGCHATVTLVVPEKNGHGDDPGAWNRWRGLIRAQIPWPLLCSDCKNWWNEQLTPKGVRP